MPVLRRRSHRSGGSEGRHREDVLALSGLRRNLANAPTFRAVHGTRLMVSKQKLPARPVLHHCPSCQEPQTRIKRVLGEGRFGSTNFVCTRMECALGIDMSKVDTWVADSA